MDSVRSDKFQAFGRRTCLFKQFSLYRLLQCFTGFHFTAGKLNSAYFMTGKQVLMIELWNCQYMFRVFHMLYFKCHFPALKICKLFHFINILYLLNLNLPDKIGRASCRERVTVMLV